MSSNRSKAQYLDMTFDIHDRYRFAQDEIARLRAALEEIAAPPREDDSDALNILQEHWSIAATALMGK